MRALIFALLLASCTPAPAPQQPAEDGTGSCEAACATGRRVCGPEPECEALCRDAVVAEREVGIVFPLKCLELAESCEAWRACK